MIAKNSLHQKVSVTGFFKPEEISLILSFMMTPHYIQATY